MPLSPLCEARHGANPFAPISGSSFVVTPGTPLEVRLADAAGVVIWELECVAADETSAPLVITRAAPPALLATVDIPAGHGRAWLLRSRVNGGVANGANDPALSYQFKLSAPTAQGLEVGALNETVESGSNGWLGIVNAAVRSAGGGSGITPPAGAGAVVYSGGDVGFAAGVEGSVLSFAGGLPMWAPPAVQPPEALDPAGGLARGANGLGVALLSSGGLYIDPSGLLRCRIGNGLNVGGAGLTLRLPASGSRLAYDGSGNVVVSGRTLVDSGEVYDAAEVTTSSSTNVLLGSSQPVSVAVGDVVELEFCGETANLEAVLRLASGATAADADVIARVVTFGGATAYAASIGRVRWVSTVAGTVHLQLIGKRIVTSRTGAVVRANKSWRVFR